MSNKTSRIVFLVVLLLVAAGVAIGQTVHWKIKISSGQLGQIIGVAPDGITESPILTAVQSTGNIGIGIVDPGTSRLTIRGVDATSANYGLMVENSGGIASMAVRNDGRVGLGTISPLTKLDIVNAGFGLVVQDGATRFAVYNSSAGSMLGTNTTHPLRLMTANSAKMIITTGNTNYVGTNDDWKFGVGADPTAVDARLLVCRRGTPGFLCTVPSPSPTVVVLGSHDNTNTTGSSLRALGSVTGGLPDVGEYVKVVGDPSLYEQGDALIISPAGLFEKSQKSHDTKVAGIVTTTAGLVAGGGDTTINYDANGKPTNRVIMALAGQLLAKVSAENGAIEVGDLLTTASKPGYLMKCPTETNEQKIQCLGSVVSKALEPLQSGTGKILVLITLQ